MNLNLNNNLILFNGFVFLFFFLPLSYFVFWKIKSKTGRYLWLTIASYVFYSFWDYRFCFLMFFSTLLAYFAGVGLLRSENSSLRKLLLWTPICIDLLILGFFKYFNFTLENCNNLAEQMGFVVPLPYLDIVLPVGISFYTFHTISYIVDAYQKKITPTTNFFEFTCYVSLFSQLVCGPIIRYWQINEDLKNIDQAQKTENLNRGWSFFAIGMAEKVLLADNLARFVDLPLRNPETTGSFWIWLSMIGFMYQYYFDFAGYSNMAVGLGYLFGLRIPQNFNSPFKSTTVSDFFRRWHISLSMVLRDLVFKPMGGSRGSAGRTFFNIMFTMVVCGLWHGAQWTYVVGFGWLGLILCLQQTYKLRWESLPKNIQWTANFCVLIIGFVFVRADTLEMVRRLLQSMFWWHEGLAMAGLAVFIPLLLISAYLSHVGPNSFELSHKWKAFQSLLLGAAFAFCMFFIATGQQSQFLYFQF